MAGQILRVTIDKLTFLVPTSLVYSDAGIWVKLEGNRVRLGLSDFTQQHSGDVTFANTKPAGTVLKVGDEFAEIETVKVNVSLPSPVNGTLVEANPALKDAAELINQDPYGKGWLVVVELADWERDRARLLDAETYAALVKGQAEAELKA
jgi:glycine cleavage system H protein